MSSEWFILCPPPLGENFFCSRENFTAIQVGVLSVRGCNYTVLSYGGGLTMKHTVSENIFLPIFFSAHFITRNCYISSKWVPFKLYWEINTVPLVKTVGDTKHLCICTTMNMINILMRGIHKLRNFLEVGMVG